MAVTSTLNDSWSSWVNPSGLNILWVLFLCGKHPSVNLGFGSFQTHRAIGSLWWASHATAYSRWRCQNSSHSYPSLGEGFFSSPDTVWVFCLDSLVKFCFHGNCYFVPKFAWTFQSVAIWYCDASCFCLRDPKSCVVPGVGDVCLPTSLCVSVLPSLPAILRLW